MRDSCTPSLTIYLDESGDLGWNFNAPYRKGGSSRHLTICAIVTSQEKKHLISRLIKNLYIKYKWQPQIEMKWNKMNEVQKDFFAQECEKLLHNNPDIKCICITVYKPNVMQHIRNDPNKLYNYMVGLILVDEIKYHEIVNFIPDQRSIKIQSGNSLSDYLQMKLWFECNAKTRVINTPLESSQCKGLQFADMLAGIAQQKFEDGGDGRLQIISNHVIFKTLYFPKHYFSNQPSLITPFVI